MELEVSKRHVFKPTLSTLMVQHVLQWDVGKRGSPSANVRGPWQMNVVLVFDIDCFGFFGQMSFIYTRKEGMKVKHEENSQNIPFWTYISKISTSTFSAWSLLLIHVHFTPNEGSKGFHSAILEIGPWKCYHEV